MRVLLVLISFPLFFFLFPPSPSVSSSDGIRMVFISLVNAVPIMIMVMIINDNYYNVYDINNILMIIIIMILQANESSNTIVHFKMDPDESLPKIAAILVLSPIALTSTGPLLVLV